jgi:hypothetical protein
MKMDLLFHFHLSAGGVRLCRRLLPQESTSTSKYLDKTTLQKPRKSQQLQNQK